MNMEDGELSVYIYICWGIGEIRERDSEREREREREVHFFSLQYY